MVDAERSQLLPSETSTKHRDIKPANIMIERQPLAAVLGDFGLSKEYLPDRSMTPWMVTLSYRAPEILARQATYYLSSDMWSVGITLVEIQQGQAPFQHH